MTGMRVNNIVIEVLAVWIAAGMSNRDRQGAGGTSGYGVRKDRGL